jgi:predicted nucleic acid-binding protein
MRFWDSSAVLPLLVQESASARMLALLAADPTAVVWWGTRVECVSALARLERDGALSSGGLATALADLRDLQASWYEIEPGDILRENAERLLRVHPLRAADALQVAAAVLAAQHRPSALPFVSLDTRLSAVAGREGFPLVC